LSLCAVTSVASMSMTSHPVRAFPAMTSHGNPEGVSAISCHTCARAFARARAIRSSIAVPPASPSARTWLAAGGDVRLPQDTEWGQHEGVLVDPDGNVIRFGSPMNAD
jgi:hypothetical protein